MRTELHLSCPMCFSFTAALVDPLGHRSPTSGDIVICSCGAVNIYDAKRRPCILRRPTVAELVMIEGNPAYQRLLTHKRGLH